jgi:hypothetical protein
MPYIMLWCRAAIAGVFLVSVLSKLWGRAALAEFIRWVASLRLVPRRWSRPLAYCAVAAEVGALILLAVPSTVVLGLAHGTVLLAMLTGAIVVTLRRGDRAPCRCFGAGTARLGLPHVIRNLVLIAVCGTGLAVAPFGPGMALHPVGVMITLLGAAVIVLLVLQFDDLVALFA